MTVSNKQGNCHFYIAVVVGTSLAFKAIRYWLCENCMQQRRFQFHNQPDVKLKTTVYMGLKNEFNLSLSSKPFKFLQCVSRIAM